MKVAPLIRSTLALIALSSVGFGQSIEAKLSQRVTSFDSTSTSTIDQLIEVARLFHLPMGIEGIEAKSEKSAPSIHVEETTLDNLIRRVVNQQPEYEYRISDGLVHVFARRYVEDQRNFLNLRIPEFNLRKATVAEARFQLWGRIIMTLHPRGGYGGGYGGVSPYKDFDMPRITVAGRNYTVRQLLNRIVINEGNALWMTRIRPPQMMTDDPFYIVDLGYPNQNGFDWIFLGLDTHFSS